MKKPWKIDSAALADLLAEMLAGGTNVWGVIGNGRLCAAMSRWGELTALRWPTPSHFDQVDYVTRWFLDAPGCRVRMGRKAPDEDFARWGRPYAMKEDMGSFGGILVRDKESEGKTLWLNRPGWQWDQRYLDGVTPALLTSARNPEHGLEVEVTDLVLPESDVLLRHFVVDGLSSAAPRPRLTYYESFSPSMKRTNFFPLNRFLGAGKNDFACIYLPADECFLHFNPGVRGTRKTGTLAALVSRSGMPVGPEEIDKAFPEGGVYIAWGSTRAPVEFQVGPSSRYMPFSRSSAAGEGSTFELASRGEFPGDEMHVGRSAACAAWDLGNPAASSGLSIYVAVGERATDAVVKLEEAMNLGFEASFGLTSTCWNGWSNSYRVPRGCGPATERVCRRALSTMAVCRDASSGAIVASMAGQPRYCYDWARDGVFLNLSLDIAGMSDWATEHLGFYASIQYGYRKLGRLRLRKPGRPTGHFPTNCFTDGRRGNIPYTEPDQTGLLLWDMWRHSRWLKDDGARFLEDIYPAIREGARALYSLWNPRLKMQKLHHEGDNPLKTRTMHGLVGLYLGLASASRAAREIGDAREAETWGSRAREAGESALAHYDPESGKFKRPGWEGYRWTVWPAGILGWDDPRTIPLANRMLDEFESIMRAERGGLAYQLEGLIGAALVFRKDSNMVGRIREGLERLCAEAVTPGTNHFGEVSLRADFDGDGKPEWQNRTSIPHVWKGALVWLLANALERPEIFYKCVPLLD